jgi:hypothetical protein
MVSIVTFLQFAQATYNGVSRVQTRAKFANLEHLVGVQSRQLAECTVVLDALEESWR